MYISLLLLSYSRQCAGFEEESYRLNSVRVEKITLEPTAQLRPAWL